MRHVRITICHGHEGFTSRQVSFMTTLHSWERRGVIGRTMMIDSGDRVRIVILAFVVEIWMEKAIQQSDITYSYILLPSIEVFAGNYQLLPSRHHPYLNKEGL